MRNDPSTRVVFEFGGETCRTVWFQDALQAEEWGDDHAPGRWRLESPDGRKDDWRGGDE